MDDGIMSGDVGVERTGTAKGVLPGVEGEGGEVGRCNGLRRIVNAGGPERVFGAGRGKGGFLAGRDVEHAGRGATCKPDERSETVLICRNGGEAAAGLGERNRRAGPNGGGRSHRRGRAAGAEK